MTVEYSGDECWYIATDAVGVFHPSSLPVGSHLITGQPYVVKGMTEDEVYAKVFVSPEREPEGSEYEGMYVIENLSPKSEAEIISAKIKDI